MGGGGGGGGGNSFHLRRQIFRVNRQTVKTVTDGSNGSSEVADSREKLKLTRKISNGYANRCFRLPAVLGIYSGDGGGRSKLICIGCTKTTMYMADTLE